MPLSEKEMENVVNRCEDADHQIISENLCSEEKQLSYLCLSTPKVQPF